jgi:hypothetical protein
MTLQQDVRAENIRTKDKQKESPESLPDNNRSGCTQEALMRGNDEWQ